MASLLKTDKISTTAGGAQEFTLPAADGTANQHLKTDGSGVLGWASPPTGVALTGSTNTWIPTITGADALTGTANFTYDGNTLDVKNSGTASSINLYCETGNAHYTKIKSGPHSGATSYTLTLPNAPPSTSGQVLSATTAGVASWADPGTVLQVVSASYPTKVTFTLSSGIYAGWEASITPSATSNKILVLGTFETSSSGTGRVQVNVKWDTSSGVDSGSQITQFTQGGYSVAAGTSSLYNQSFNALVSTNSTSQLYFKPIVIKHDGGTGYLNFYGAHSTLTLMEIKA